MAQILIIEDNMDGYEICRILKENKNTRFVPIIMLTGLNKLLIV